MTDELTRVARLVGGHRWTMDAAYFDGQGSGLNQSVVRVELVCPASMADEMGVLKLAAYLQKYLEGAYEYASAQPEVVGNDPRD